MKFPVVALVAMLPVALPALARADSWQGFYAGGQLGYAVVKDEGIEYVADVPDGVTESTTFNSASYGLHAGFSRRAAGNLVVGVEAEYSKNDGKGEDFQRVAGIILPAYPVTSQLDATFVIRGKVGLLVNDRGLVFATLGPASARYTRGWYDTPKDTSNDDWQEGGVAGIGYEYACSERINAVVEYRYADYGDETVKSVAYGGSYTQRMSLTSSGLVAGVSYRF